MGERDSASTTTRHFDNRASCFSLNSTTASCQEALPLCPTSRQVTRSRTLFEPDRAHDRIENGQSAVAD
ncbi:D-alanine--D-alanine ligase [Streptomyces swartbergensis]|uniref:D-alanine--D-alanine ligase n=1 Tax=Streptomyces swartbergensis TaxID=487165 RepID=A0A243RZA6_9ACTN|nr:D-alanine--D-alanine ligase [Streptomyces swartbergensis]